MYNSQSPHVAPSVGSRALPSPIGTAQADHQSQSPAGYSPKFGHYTGHNGTISNSDIESKHGMKRKRSVADTAHRHTSEDSYIDGGEPYQRADTSKDSQFSLQQKNGANPAQDVKKRTKTQRACDKCRTKKIRCDIIADADPPLCSHCKQYNYDCTFFLPIQETRFKKKRQEEDAALKASQNRPFAPSGTPAPIGERQESGHESRTFGPTSIPFLINSMATLPLPNTDSIGLHPRSLWNVVNAGDGYIRVMQPSQPTLSEPILPKSMDIRVERDIVERLINSYFANISPIFPVITKSEFVAFQPNPPPMLLYSICLMAASLRDTPSGIFDHLRRTVASLIRSEDVLSTPTLANVQALLILSMAGDCHGTQGNLLMSYAWTRTGTAIRMAQDLNLHRAEISREGMETRRRLWATCVVADRWYSAAFGYPQMIDLTDCDVRLPTPQDQGIGYLNALTRLSIILGEVLKAIYSPSGLYSANDAILEDILRRLELWKIHLPEELAFTGPDSGPAAGLLHLYYTCVCMIFWRVFMRISFICPPHIQFCLNVTEWSKVIDNSRAAIEWFVKHDRYWETWFPTSYALVSCALCQYHAWARRKDPEAVASLLLLRDAVKRWETSTNLVEHVGRAKTGEIICLLYEVTQSKHQPSGPSRAIAPTPGVRDRSSASTDTLIFRKDSKTGGAYITSDPRIAAELHDMTQGIIITEPSTPVTSAGLEEGKHHPNAQGGSRPDGFFPQVTGGSGSNSRNSTDGNNSAEVGLDGVPGNMFDWGGWDTWLASLGTEGYPSASTNGLSSMP